MQSEPSTHQATDRGLFDVPASSLPTDATPKHRLETVVNGRTVDAHIQELLEPIRYYAEQSTIRRIEQSLVTTSLHMLSHFREAPDLAHVSVLDIACGGRAECSWYTGPRFQPWYARLLTSFGASVIGIDNRPSHPEPFVHVVADLESGIVERLGVNPFDLVVWCNYYPWDLEAILAGNPDGARPAVRKLWQEVLGRAPAGYLYDGEHFTPLLPFSKHVS